MQLLFGTFADRICLSFRAVCSLPSGKVSYHFLLPQHRGLLRIGEQERAREAWLKSEMIHKRLDGICDCGSLTD